MLKQGRRIKRLPNYEHVGHSLSSYFLLLDVELEPEGLV